MKAHLEIEQKVARFDPDYAEKMRAYYWQYRKTPPSRFPDKHDADDDIPF